MARLRAELPGYARIPTGDLKDSVTGQFDYLLDSLTGGPDRTGLPAGSLGPEQTGRRRAEQEVPLHDVLEAYRITVAELWQEVQVAALDGGADPRLVVQVAGEMFGRLEEVSRLSVLAHQSRSAELLVEAEAERAATFEALLTGHLRGSDEIWRAAARLDLPLEGRFVAVAAEATAVADPLRGVHSALTRHGLGSAWRMTPDLKLGLISLKRRDVETVCELLRRTATGRVGVSTVFGSLSQLAQGVYQARLMMGAIPPGQVAVRPLEETPLVALLVASPQTARTLIQAVLGSLLRLPARTRVPLLETLAQWLAAKGSVPDAAAALFCHPNTVRYRINRICDVLGVDLADPAQLAQVSVAMDALALFPVDAE